MSLNRCPNTEIVFFLIFLFLFMTFVPLTIADQRGSWKDTNGIAVVTWRWYKDQWGEVGTITFVFTMRCIHRHRFHITTGGDKRESLKSRRPRSPIQETFHFKTSSRISFSVFVTRGCTPVRRRASRLAVFTAARLGKFV